MSFHVKQTSRIPFYTHCRLLGFLACPSSIRVGVRQGSFWLEFCQVLEKAETNLANIVVQFLTIQVHFDIMEAKCYICNKFINVAVGIVSKWYKQYFLHPVYVIAMYLALKYCNLAISKNFSHDYLKPEIVKLALHWKFKKDKCIQLAQDIHKYNSFIFTKDHKTMTPMYFWKTTQQFANLMRKLASFVFQLKGHTAPVETLF